MRVFCLLQVFGHTNANTAALPSMQEIERCFIGDINASVVSFTGVRPYQCEHCGAAFTHCNRLKIHLRTHSGDRPYKCPDCGKGFAQSAHLTVHTRIHTGDKPFKCKECNAAFLDSTHLRRHERTHTAEKPHRCQDCGASYSTAFGLRRHEWSHTDHEKPYKCGGCLRTFTTNFCLKRHGSKGKCKAQESEEPLQTVPYAQPWELLSSSEKFSFTSYGHNCNVSYIIAHAYCDWPVNIAPLFPRPLLRAGFFEIARHGIELWFDPRMYPTVPDENVDTKTALAFKYYAPIRL